MYRNPEKIFFHLKEAFYFIECVKLKGTVKSVLLSHSIYRLKNNASR